VTAAVNPDVASALAQDPTQLDLLEQYMGLAKQRPMEPTGVTEPAGVTELDVPQPDVPELGTPDQELGDQPNP
jgi:hypothetical protein